MNAGKKECQILLWKYEKLGFEEAGIRKNFYEKPVENALIMWKHD